MKFFLLIFISLFFFNSPAFSQNNKDDLQLVDSFSDVTCEDLLARLDGFSFALNQNPDSTGYIVIYDNNNPIDNKFLERYIIRYQKYRNTDKNRLQIITAKAEQGKRVDLWISRNEAKKPKVEEVDFTFILPKSEKPILFINEWVDIVKIDGKWTYIGNCPACCIEGYYLDYLAEFLKTNSQINAHIKIRGNSRSYSKRLEKLIRDEIITENTIPSNRFQISYQGIDEGIAQMPKNNATIEVVFVPQK